MTRELVPVDVSDFQKGIELVEKVCRALCEGLDALEERIEALEALVSLLRTKCGLPKA